MRDYGKISTSIWNSRKFRGLKSDDAKLLYFYFHTCQNVNSIGTFVIRDGYACADLEWDQIRYRKALDSLSIAHLVSFDDAENTLRIVDYLKHDPFTNPKHAAGAVKLAISLPDGPEKIAILQELAREKHVKEIDKINAALAEISDSLSKGYRNPEPEPEPEPKKEMVVVVGARELETVGFFDQVLDAAGIARQGRIPERWMPPASMLHVNRWLTMGLTEAEVVDVIRASQAGRSDKPAGPAAFDRAMKRLAGEKMAPPIEPGELKRAGAKDDGKRFDRAITELADRVRSGQATLGPDPGDPFAE